MDIYIADSNTSTVASPDNRDEHDLSPFLVRTSPAETLSAIPHRRAVPPGH
ncbi:hypothetical protein [Komagataeibacter diospyri]|uniref:hypothetical protein n=1 Tax=Komagataeibacter diospyri TaxID=1932662 RepID=UPI00139693F3|nr:hypothetical protein [Komagataeibacter diospyri]